jgi:hypothetical protein
MASYAEKRNKEEVSGGEIYILVLRNKKSRVKPTRLYIKYPYNYKLIPYTYRAMMIKF